MNSLWPLEQISIPSKINIFPHSRKDVPQQTCSCSCGVCPGMEDERPPYQHRSHAPSTWSTVYETESCSHSLGFPGDSVSQIAVFCACILEKAMAPHSSTLAWKIPWMEEPGRLWYMASQSQTQLSEFTFTFHFHALEKEIATHSSVLAWRIPGTGEPGGLPSMGSHRVRHD